MRAQDLDWLRDGSVNLLSLDLGRWSDITVIDDKRVGDLVRERAGSSTVPLTLSQGIAVAKRAGAGMLVMGDFYKVGGGARLVANVFDVRTGTKVRTASQQAMQSDSLLTVFSPLALGVLAVPPPPDAKLGAIGTTRIDAYQAYLDGVRALNRFDLETAVAAFNRALSIDSTFALAHYKLSQALGWGESDKNVASRNAHAQAAERFGVSLPPRERTLIASQAAQTDNDYNRSCTLLTPLVARDSNDVEALYEWGECNYHDTTLVRLADTTRGHFVGDWNTSLRAMTRVLELDPGFHLAFNHILDILSSDARFTMWCQPDGKQCQQYFGLLRRDHDSLVITPIARFIDAAAYDSEYHRSVRERPHFSNLRAAQRIAQAWVEADPGEDRAHYYLGHVLLILGDVEHADSELRLVRAGHDPYLRFIRLRDRIEASVKLGHGAEGRALLDTLVREFQDSASDYSFGPMDLIFGRPDRLRRFQARTYRNWGPVGMRYYPEISRAVLGIPGDSVNAIEHAWFDSNGVPNCRNPVCRRSYLVLTMIFALRTPRTWWPPFPQDPVDIRMDGAAAMSRGDTAALRRGAVTLDSLSRAIAAAGYEDEADEIVAADAFLLLHDSTAALQSMRFFVDSVIPTMPMMRTINLSLPLAGPLWPRAMLLRADLEAAKGNAAAARYWYSRVADLWAEAGPELQPTLARIHRALGG